MFLTIRSGKVTEISNTFKKYEYSIYSDTKLSHATCKNLISPLQGGQNYDVTELEVPIEDKELYTAYKIIVSVDSSD